LRQFATAFDMVEEGKTPDPDFWGRICHHHQNGSGPDYMSGWLGAFCVWNGKGKWQAGNMDRIVQPLAEWEKSNLKRNGPEPSLLFAFDGIRYPCIDTDEIPPGSCEVDVLLNDNGELMDCMMLAGHVGNMASASGPQGIVDTLQPQAEWFMFVKEGGQRVDYKAMFSDSIWE
jgi:hypothetical protein